MSAAAIVTLLSDFGSQNAYVGAMKGAIATVNPQIVAIDLTHQVPPQDIAGGRFELASAVPYFPAGTVHVAVVDPGVGSARRGVAIAFEGGFLVGPDNGLLSGALAVFPALSAVELTAVEYWRSPAPSITFHGRDIFAPVGAHLASGVPLSEVGSAIAPETLATLSLPPYRQIAAELVGCVQHCDVFGNLATNIPAAAVLGREWSLRIGDRSVPGVRTYGDRPPGEWVALIGSHGWVEVAVNQGSARSRLQLGVGAEVAISFDPPSR